MSRPGEYSFPDFRRSAICFFLLVPLLGIAEPLGAWPAPVYRSMVYDTLRLLPPSLGRVLWRNDEHLLRGVYRLEGEMASALAKDGLKGVVSMATTQEVERRVDEVASMVHEHQPFRDIAFELGKLLRIAADLADPSIMGASNGELVGASQELSRFVDMHLQEFPLVYDRQLPSTLEGAPVASLLEQLSLATDGSANRLAQAFWKDGKLVSADVFDYRSVPFAETSLGYSRGVTAASFLWLAAWAKANGDFTGYRFFDESASKHDQRFQEKKERK